MKPDFLSSRYYLKFGLDRDPFPQNSSQNKLFLTHELTHLVDDFVSVIKTQAEILVVESPPGGGKSVLAGYLNYVKEANWYLSLVNANDKMGKTELAHAIISQHFPRHRFDKTQSDAILQEFLQLYQRNGKLPVVLIDDAHLLPQETLKFILKISSLRHEGAQFRIVLFTDLSISRQPGRPSLMDTDSGQREYRQIPVFSKSQTAKYMEHRLALSGQYDIKPFSDQDIDQIFRDSSGIPGEINRLAKEHMQNIVIPGRAHKMMFRAAASIAAGLIIFVAVYAGMSADSKDTNTDAPVLISLDLPDKGMETTVIENSKTVNKQQRQPMVVTRKNEAAKTAKVITKRMPKLTNKEVLLADMKRQTEIRNKKIREEKAKIDLRMQLAAYDLLALRVSDVVQN